MNREHPRITELRRALDELESQWNRLGAPIATHLRPGLTDAELSNVELELGTPIPPELRGLWTWHDGTNSSESTVDIGPMGMEFFPSSVVLAYLQQNMEVHPEAEAEFDPEQYWHPTWIPFMAQDAQRLYVDSTRLVASGASPVRMVSWEWEDYDVDISHSLRDLVQNWTWLLANDYYVWDLEAGAWQCDFGRIPMPLRRWG